MNSDLEAHIESHIGELQRGDHNVRGRAALALGALGDGRAGEALIRALRVEPDPFVRENLTWALARLGGIVVPELIRLLGDADPSARHHAAHALSKIRDARAVDALIDALRDRDATVVAKTVFALGQIADPRAIPALVRLFGHESKDVESALASVLERFGAAAVVPVVEALADESWRAREQAAYALGSIGHADAVPALVGALRDEHWQVRFASVQALGDLGGETPSDAVRSMCGDPDARVRGLVDRYRSRGPAARLAIARSRPPNTTA